MALQDLTPFPLLGNTVNEYVYDSFGNMMSKTHFIPGRGWGSHVLDFILDFERDNDKIIYNLELANYAQESTNYWVESYKATSKALKLFMSALNARITSFKNTFGY